MTAVMGRAIWIKPMLIVNDLKRRLTPEFFANLVAQLSSAAAAPSVSCVWKKEQPTALLKDKCEAKVAGHDRMRMAALQT
jgi:hypothetical protein